MRIFEGGLQHFERWAKREVTIKRPKGEGGPVNIWENIEDFLRSMNGKPVELAHEKYHFSLKEKLMSMHFYSYEDGPSGPVTHSKGHVVTDAHYCLADALAKFSGYKVKVIIKNGQGMSIAITNRDAFDLGKVSPRRFKKLRHRTAPVRPLNRNLK